MMRMTCRPTLSTLLAYLDLENRSMLAGKAAPCKLATPVHLSSKIGKGHTVAKTCHHLFGNVRFFVSV